MKFGKVEQPELVDFVLPLDHVLTNKTLKEGNGKPLSVFVGCAKWNRQDLKGFYPRGTKDELAYYSTQFNSIELNATFYRIYGPDQIEKWRNKTPADFKFFPKISQPISQFKRLKNIERELDAYIYGIEKFEEKLGMIFLQMHPTFKPSEMSIFQTFIENWPEYMPLSVEFRHTDWYNDKAVANELFAFMKEKNVATIITDTAGRRDLIHMCLTTSSAFIRYNGANHATDYTRLDDWVARIKEWVVAGIENVYFFIHQNHELESPFLSGYFIEQLNSALSTNLKIPDIYRNRNTLF